MVDVELYTFACGLQVWRYTNALLPVTYLGKVFSPASIKRSAIEQSTDMEKNTLTITVPVTLPFMDLFRPQPPLRKILVNVQRYTRGADSARTIWSGTVGSPDSGQHTAAITCLSKAASQQNTGLRRKWSRTCPFTHYSPLPMCGVPRADFRVNGMLTASAGNTVQASAFAAYADHYFVGGYLEWLDNGDVAVAFITGHVGETLTCLTYGLPPVGAAVAAYPGCDHSDGDTGCARFGNNINYGGQKFIPLKNPFGTNRVL